ncbi:MAG: deoxyribodipyrimidine photo-lyase, partial [Gammaproteobacteria bacterium]|nr:deoxyribodipyrimidine photo-lyase [Gammaproteobacteria bacterium]
AFNPNFENFPWQENETALTAWQQGCTGIPIVDAGMRQLWQTGWMHNRVRMIVASFLSKNLLIHWQYGARWFWDTLVDADLAQNSLNWQWVAGSGVDAAPYFRIFNPVSQGEKFDSSGDYVRLWVPELKQLNKKWIHKPWQAPDIHLRDNDVELGQNYPRPIVDLAISRNRALEAYKKMKNSD